MSFRLCGVFGGNDDVEEDEGEEDEEDGESEWESYDEDSAADEDEGAVDESGVADDLAMRDPEEESRTDFRECGGAGCETCGVGAAGMEWDDTSGWDAHCPTCGHDADFCRVGCLVEV